MKTKKKGTNAKKLAKPRQPQVMSNAARAHIAEGTRLFALAGRPTKAQFVRVYGPNGPTITWAQRAKAGVDEWMKQYRPSVAKRPRVLVMNAGVVYASIAGPKM